MNRREFLVDVGRGMLVASVGATLAQDLGLAPGALAADDSAGHLTFGAMEPLVDLMQATIRGQRSPGTIVIAPECEEVPGIGLRRFSLGRRYIEAGEAAVEAAVPRIAAALPWMRS